MVSILEIIQYHLTSNNPHQEIRTTHLVIHSTANPETPAIANASWFNQAAARASANYIVDWDSVIECIPYGYKAWHCGSIGNTISCGIELCETSDNDKFHHSLKNLRELVNCLLCINPSLIIVSHAWVSDNLGDTDHQDPLEYLESHNMSWDDLVSYLTKEETEEIEMKLDATTVIKCEGKEIGGLILDGVTYAAVRKICELIGKEVTWNEEKELVEIL